MKYLLAALILFTGTQISAQEKHFMYIQADNSQLFYVQVSGKTYSSTASGYAILPKLSNGDYKLTIGFPQNMYPERNYDVSITGNDLGFALKNFTDKGWVLFNLLTFETLAGNINTEATTAQQQPKQEEDDDIINFNRPGKTVTPAKTAAPKAPPAASVVTEPAPSTAKTDVKTEPVIKESPVVQQLVDNTIKEPLTSTATVKVDVKSEPVVKAAPIVEPPVVDNTIKEPLTSPASVKVDVKAEPMVKAAPVVEPPVVDNTIKEPLTSPASVKVDVKAEPVVKPAPVVESPVVDNTKKEPLTATSTIQVEVKAEPTIKAAEQPKVVATTAPLVNTETKATTTVVPTETKAAPITEVPAPKVETPVVKKDTAVVVKEQPIAKAEPAPAKQETIEPKKEPVVVKEAPIVKAEPTPAKVEEVQPKKETVAVVKQEVPKAEMPPVVTKQPEVRKETPAAPVQQPVVKAEVKQEAPATTTTTIETKSAISTPETAVVTPEILSATVQKITERSTKDSVEMSFVDGQGKDTVQVIIPKGRSTRMVTEMPNVPINACQAIAMEEDYYQLRKRMLSKMSDDKMISEAIKAYNSKCYTTLQVRALSVLFMSDEGRYKFFDASYKYVADPERYGMLQKELIDPYYANRFKAMLR